MKRLVTILWIFLAVFPSNEVALGQSSNRVSEIHKVYVDSFGSAPGAAYLRDKLLLRLSKTRALLIVADSTAADVILRGNAGMSLVGYWQSNPRIRYRTSTAVPVYDAKMTVQLDDSKGRNLWSGTLRPRFRGSQYVSDNVVNQAAQQVTNALR